MSKFSFKTQPQVGETIDAWMTRAYAPEARGPGNELIHPGVVYVRLTEGEWAHIVDFADVPEVLWGPLRKSDDPCSFVSPVSRQTHAILAFDSSRLDGVRRENGFGGARVECQAPQLSDLLAAWVRPAEPDSEPVMVSDETLELIRNAPAPAPTGLR